MNRGLHYCMREYDSIFHFKKSFFIDFEEVAEFGHRELMRAFLQIVKVVWHRLLLTFVLACSSSVQGYGSMLHPYLACYPLIKLLASLCLFEATGRLCKGCLVRDISLVGRGVIAS